MSLRYLHHARRPSRWTSVTAGGEALPALLADAIAAPDAVTDDVDERTCVTDHPIARLAHSGEVGSWIAAGSERSRASS